MIKCLEHRWNSWEQPLLLLSFLLHSKYGISVFSSINEQLYFQLSDWLIYYYCAWFDNKPHTLLPELEKYRKEEKPFTKCVTNQFNNNIMGYWEYCTTSAKELEIELSIKQYKQNNVALPILKENESNDVFIVDNDSDDKAKEVNEENEVISINNWNKIIQQWVNMISEEEENEIDLTVGKDNVDRIICDTDHPAINNDAKWKLETLFKNNIPDPEFIYNL
ncbi:20898_t:CDS:2 [Cetraspora pellucida]|uniref:20898_t:CDS:1 n=1 Tax=Cetraspora pellucida TaxID=1433469 RepID=A0A9N9IVU5_9GLOM|nr:20898_t:CDS:2 [Cetraspora pellucida]